MSARTVQVRIGRLIVDAPLRGEAVGWGEAIARALQARLRRGPAAESAAGSAGAPVPETIARHVARRVADAAPRPQAPSTGGHHAGA